MRHPLIRQFVVATLLGVVWPSRAARDRRFLTSWRGILRQTLMPLAIYYFPDAVNYISGREVFVRRDEP